MFDVLKESGKRVEVVNDEKWKKVLRSLFESRIVISNLK